MIASLLVGFGVAKRGIEGSWHAKVLSTFLGKIVSDIGVY